MEELWKFLTKVTSFVRKKRGFKRSAINKKALEVILSRASEGLLMVEML